VGTTRWGPGGDQPGLGLVGVQVGTRWGPSGARWGPGGVEVGPGGPTWEPPGGDQVETSRGGDQVGTKWGHGGDQVGPGGDPVGTRTNGPATTHGHSWQDKAAVPLKYKAVDNYNNDGKPIKTHEARDMRPTQLPIPLYLRRHRVGRIHHMPLEGFAVVFGVWDIHLSLSRVFTNHDATARSPGAGAGLHDD
jgi:hypothetical protein